MGENISGREAFLSRSECQKTKVPRDFISFEFEFGVQTCNYFYPLGKGGKNRRRGKNENESEKRELVFKEDGQGDQKMFNV